MRAMRLFSAIAVLAFISTSTLLAQGGQKPATAKPAATSAGAGPVIVVETEKGTFEFETYPNEAPKTVAHILGLVKKRFYNGHRIHRVEPNFVVQMGDPLSRDFAKKSEWGNGNSGTPIGASEVSKKRTHVRGAVAMAYGGDPKSADSQFYVTLSPQPRLDPDYTVFGKVISGMDVVTKLVVGDRISRVTVREAK